MKLPKKKNSVVNIKNYFLSVGRLTKQKNFIFLCKAFRELVKKNDKLKLVIAGSGEEELNLKRFIKENKLKKNIILLGHIDNIYPYFKNSKGFILSSLWEDPGFVLIEASFCRTPVLSANSWPGPIELIRDKINGIIFESNNIESFVKKFQIFENIDNINQIKLNNLKQSKNFTLFSHYKNLSKLI